MTQISAPLTAFRLEYQPFSQRYAAYGNKNISSWIIEPQLTYEKKHRQRKTGHTIGGNNSTKFQ